MVVDQDPPQIPVLLLENILVTHLKQRNPIKVFIHLEQLFYGAVVLFTLIGSCFVLNSFNQPDFNLTDPIVLRRFNNLKAYLYLQSIISAISLLSSLVVLLSDCTCIPNFASLLLRCTPCLNLLTTSILLLLAVQSESLASFILRELEPAANGNGVLLVFILTWYF